MFVEAVLHVLPTVVSERGIYSMSSIEKMFSKVYSQSISKKVLGTFMNKEDEPKFAHACDYHSEATMSDKERLVQAKYFMFKNCLAEAVDCMENMKGEKLPLLKTWIEEARYVVEARQVSEILTAYATSKGMGSLF